MGAGAIIGGRYELVRGIGAGGMGEVWEASHLVTKKHVAIKILNAKYAKQPSVRARFLLEARAACRVRHPNVVQVHDVLERDDGAPVMVMDLLEGEALAAKLEREHVIALGPLATILVPVVDAVRAAHALGIVHRDLKPDNLFLERLTDGTTIAKVLDFGIAKVARGEDERDDPALTGTGAVLGTPYYMSPEQLFGEKDLDHRSDVWSLGIILYECLTGRRPTEADNFGQILKTITTGSIPPIDMPSLPRDVVDLVNRMLKRARAERPDLDEVLLVLRRHASGTLALDSQPPPPLRVAIGSDASGLATQLQLDETAPAHESPIEPVNLPVRSRRMLWLGLAACLVLAPVAVVRGLGGQGASSAPTRQAAQPSGLGLVPVTSSTLPPEAAALPPIVAEPVVVAPSSTATSPKKSGVGATPLKATPPSTPPSIVPSATAPIETTAGVGKLYADAPF